MTNKIKNEKGFTFLVAVITTGVLLIVAFVVINVATKQLVLSNANKESQYAFYNTDSGTECAIYWDLPKDGSASPFEPTSSSQINCGNTVPISITHTNNPSYATSSFQVNFTTGCAKVDVVKIIATGGTKIESHGYNNCTAGFLRRFERGIKINY